MDTGKHIQEQHSESQNRKNKLSQKEVRQSEPMSPNLFGTVLEEVFRQLSKENKGIIINGENLSSEIHRRFYNIYLSEK